MTALPAEQPLELDSARIYKLPPREDVSNPILEAEPEAYQPPPDAVLNREPPKRKRKAKATGKRPGRPAKAKAPEVPAAPAQPAPTPQTVVAAPPRDPFFSKPVSTTTGWAIGAMMFFLMVGAALGFWAIR